MKQLLIIAPFLIIALTSCKQENVVKNKFPKETFEVKVFYVSSTFGAPRIELRDKSGKLVVAAVEINKNAIDSDCEFFYYFQKPNELDVCVNCGDTQWIWRKKDQHDWEKIID